MYKTIMVPTDGSGFDREAILVALRVAERCDAKVRLVRVLNLASYFGATSPESRRRVLIGWREAMAGGQRLYALAAECRGITSAERLPRIWNRVQSPTCWPVMRNDTTST